MSLNIPEMDIEKIKLALKRPVVLVGMMGAGKTTVGKYLANSLSLEFKDSDDVIVEREGRSIPEIFEQDGEAGFRKIERQTIADLFTQAGVLGVGGGAFAQEDTREIIQAHSLSVWLSGDPATLYERIKGDENRPKLQDFSTFSALCEERYPLYGEADITVDTIGKNSEEVGDKVLMVLQTHLKL